MDKKFLIFFAVVVSLSALAIFGVVWAGVLTPPGSALSGGVPVATMYTLTDVYNLIQNNTTATEANHLLVPSSGPATTFHSVSEIYALLANLIKKDKVKTGTTYLGVTGDFGVTDIRTDVPTISGSLTSPGSPASQGYTLEDIWNLISNTIATAGNHNLYPAVSPAGTMHTISDIYTALSTLIVANTIATGTTYLGVAGTYSLTPPDAFVVTCTSGCPATVGVEGTYNYLQVYNGKSCYKHATNNFYLTYFADGFDSYWITDVSCVTWILDYWFSSNVMAPISGSPYSPGGLLNHSAGTLTVTAAP